MNGRRIASGTLLLCLGLALGSVRAGTFTLPPKTVTTLPNGLTCVFMEKRNLPLVAVRVLVDAGAARDPQGKEGLANFTANFLSRGTEKHDAVTLSQEIDYLGATLHATANKETAVVSGSFLSRTLEEGMALLEQLLVRPVFPQSEFDRLQRQAQAQLLQMLEDPSQIANLHFDRAIYGDHPYAHSIIGTKASVAAFTRADAVQFYGRYYRPNGAILVMVGDFDTAAARKLVEARLGSWKRGKRKPRPKGTLKALTGRQVLLVNKPDATQTQIRIGNLGVPIGHPDEYALDVVNTVLGAGFTSRLVDILRVDKGLTYSASSRFPKLRDGGMYAIRTFTKNETTLETVQTALDIVRDLKTKGPSAQELEKAHNYLSGQFPKRLETYAALASRLADLEFYDLPADYLETYQGKVRAVDMAECRRILKEYFPLQDLRLVIVSNAEQVRADLQKVGPVTVRELDAK